MLTLHPECRQFQGGIPYVPQERRPAPPPGLLLCEVVQLKILKVLGTLMTLPKKAGATKVAPAFFIA